MTASRGVRRRAIRRPIDRVWNFFSSVKVAVGLIVITLLAAMIGTIYPQENAFIIVRSVDVLRREVRLDRQMVLYAGFFPHV